MGSPERIRVEIEGVVQGVGFRPFVYRLARRHALAGWVSNTAQGVSLEAEGNGDDVAAFFRALQEEAPPRADITAMTKTVLGLAGCHGFSIVASSQSQGLVQISPDYDVCQECLTELFDPHDRRYRYPFITCTHCGPRYSIITHTPYDRETTTMAEFAMCDDCRQEYEDPANRRFHAQPNACPRCGPKVVLLDGAGIPMGGDPVEEARRLLDAGKIIAVKGVGGYHLAVDAGNDAAVAELRRRKSRQEKPFALMVADLDQVHAIAHADAGELLLLRGAERPVVVLHQRQDHCLSPLVAPGNGFFGVMLPSTPLHHLLLHQRLPLVMTSANRADEPIVHGEGEALAQLGGITDFFLVHDRRIHARSDDSVLRVFRDKPIFIRRSRGFVPRSVRLGQGQTQVLAVGAEQKGVICLTKGDRAFMSQHLGDLHHDGNLKFMIETVSHMEAVLGITPRVVAHDLHPDYQSTTYACGRDVQHLLPVQHHHAHMASCMAENNLEGEVLGVVFDGTGYGTDGSIWGGEFLVGGYHGYRRAGHFSPVAMPGGDMAIREPWRMALSHCHAVFGDAAFSLPLPFLAALSTEEKPLLTRMLMRGINSPLTSSCGRLFDAVASLIGLCHRVSYEGQAAMELEALAGRGKSAWCYPYGIVSGDGVVIDCRQIIDGLVQDIAAGEDPATMALRFHQTIAAAAADACVKISSRSGVTRVVLSGGGFQNRLLTAEMYQRLGKKGLTVFSHQVVPPNDGGLALGQAVIAGRSVLCA